MLSFYGPYIDDYAILHYVEDVHVIWYVHILILNMHPIMDYNTLQALK